MGAEPDWYRDPSDRATWWFWDGSQWTGHRKRYGTAGAISVAAALAGIGCLFLGFVGGFGCDAGCSSSAVASLYALVGVGVVLEVVALVVGVRYQPEVFDPRLRTARRISSVVLILVALWIPLVIVGLVTG